ncbi:MAG TPA: phosphotransferase [Candidatus Saccharimonadales bacterium]|nr:phosphotransferase [Candidatus Saccharimonadales bacterium]
MENKPEAWSETPWMEIHPDDHPVLDDICERYSMLRLHSMGGFVNRVYLLVSLDPDSPFAHGLTVKITGGHSESDPAREVESLKLLHALPDPPLALPELVEFNQATGTRVFTTIAGTSEAYSTLNEMFGPHSARTLGKRIGAAHAWQEQLDPEAFISRMKAIGASPYTAHQEAVDWLATFDHPLTPNLSRLARQEAVRLLEFYPEGLNTGQRVVHMDCRPENLMFTQLPDGSYGPTGYIDHEALALGDTERSMRFWPAAGETVFGGCVDAYEELTGNTVNCELVRCWANVQALLTAAFQVVQGVPRVQRMVVGYAALQHHLLPDVDWRELLDPALVPPGHKPTTYETTLRGMIAAGLLR